MLNHATNTIFFYFCLIGTVVKDTTPGVSVSAVYWARFDGDCRRNDQLLALVGGSPEVNPKTTGHPFVKRIDHVIGR